MAKMNLSRAFSYRMLDKVIKHVVLEGYYDLNNDWIEGTKLRKVIYGVINTGNQFSQFDEGIALKNEDGGIRYSDYISFGITNKYTLEIGDKLEHKGKYYNVLQMSDKSQFNFNLYLLERSEEWEP